MMDVDRYYGVSLYLDCIDKYSMQVEHGVCVW